MRRAACLPRIVYVRLNGSVLEQALCQDQFFTFLRRHAKHGDTFYEPALELHAVSSNPSDKVKSRALAVLVHPRDAKELVIPEPAKKEK
jgi:hypothetical protein